MLSTLYLTAVHYREACTPDLTVSPSLNRRKFWKFPGDSFSYFQIRILVKCFRSLQPVTSTQYIKIGTDTIVVRARSV